MNLKNSKFYKRIQELRRISKEKIRKDLEQQRHCVKNRLVSVFSERDGNVSDWSELTPTGPPMRKAIRSPRLKAKKFRTKVMAKRATLKTQTDLVEREIDVISLGNDRDDISDSTEQTKLNSLIQLNNVCFRVKCNARYSQHPTTNYDNPSISDTKSSICVTNSRYAMIGKISKSLGFRLVKETKLWNILWSDSFPGVELFKNMKRFQQINHFPGMIEICRKDLLSRNLNRMLKLYPRDYKIFPKTWMLPADYGDAMSFALNHCKTKPRTFILKPDSGAQGRGIWLTNDLKTINPTERLICQTYITKPLLIDGYKFDLRVYALITSVDPLRIFVYNEGLARFATNKYVEPTPDNSTDLFMHLTNYSVNKRNSQYEQCDNDDCGSKRTFSAINNWMARRNYDVDDFWENVDDVIIKTVLSAWPVLKHNYHACFPGHDKIQACFEILGFDILVDAKLKPYILEVNHSPSFHTNEMVDREVKRPLIRDTLLLVSTVLADKKQIMREDRKRVKQRLLKPALKGEAFHKVATNLSNRSDAPKKSRIENPPDENECPVSSLAQQIAWEESHLGNFRRIMPPTNPAKVNYYCQFYGQTNQVSIFAETAASKKREDLAKKMRLQIQEKQAKQQDLINGRARIEERRKKRLMLPRSVREKQRVHMYRLQENWIPGFVSEAEERLRRTWLQMRSESLRTMKIHEIIYQHLYKSGYLTNTDILIYPTLYRNLQNGYDLLADSQQVLHFVR